MNFLAGNHLRGKNGYRARILLALALMAGACTTKESLNEKDLVGDWTFVHDVSPLNMPIPSIGNARTIGFRPGKKYRFYTDGTAETMGAQYELGKDRKGHRKLMIYGHRSSFRILNDSLSFLQLKDSTWGPGLKIHKLTRDLLIIEYEPGLYLRYKRDVYDLNKVPEFDAIALETSGCYGPCEGAITLIRSDGEVVFYGDVNVDSIGLYTASISPELYTNLRDNFRRVDIKQVASDKDLTVDDEQLVSTFSKSGVLYNTIKDNGSIGLADLTWAYIPLRYLHKNLTLKKIPEDSIIGHPFDFMHFHAVHDSATYTLLRAESFVLWDHFRHGKKLPTAPKISSLTFTTDSSNQTDKPFSGIRTDGRIFVRYLNGKVTMVSDLGFNFFTANPQLLNRDLP